MNKTQSEKTKAQELASLIEGTSSSSSTMATVQRSHRFPLHIFTQIENMARIADVPISMIINELLECGLESVKSEVSEDLSKRISTITAEQLNRPLQTAKLDSKKHKTTK